MHLKKAILFAFLLLFSFSCQSGSQKKITQEIRLSIETEPPTLDPRLATDDVSMFVIKQCQDGLMEVGEGNTPIPGIAERYTLSEDGKIYTFYLRKAQWSNGKPLTAFDFERTWKSHLDPTFNTGTDFFLIKNWRSFKNGEAPLTSVGIHALDEHTLKVELEHPAPYFLTALASPMFFPTPIPFDPKVSCGPFQLYEWRHFDEITLKKNPAYWDAKNVRLETVHLSVIEDLQTALTLFEKGELDWLGTPFAALPIDAIDTLRKKKLLKYMPVLATYHYTFNTTVFPLNNPKIRKALSLAINRAAIVENITQLGQIPATSFVPPRMWGGKIPPYFEENLDEARALFKTGLEELGTSLEKLPQLTLSYNTLERHHKIAQAIQQQWMETFGLKVKLENKEWKVFLNDCHRGKFDIARRLFFATIDDPITFLELFRYPDKSLNWSQWNSPSFSTLVKEGEECADPAKRLELFQQAEKILIDAMPIAPIFTETGTFLKKSHVKNVAISEFQDMKLKHAYIEYE